MCSLPRCEEPQDSELPGRSRSVPPRPAAAHPQQESRGTETSSTHPNGGIRRAAECSRRRSSERLSAPTNQTGAMLAHPLPAYQSAASSLARAHSQGRKRLLNFISTGFFSPPSF